jgi:integrase
VEITTPAALAKAVKNERPAKPKGSPLFAHASGRWAKKVAGKFVYLGSWRTAPGADCGHEAALDKWLAEKDYLLNGRPVPTPAEGVAGVSVGELVDAYLNHSREVVEAGKKTRRTHDDAIRSALRMVEFFGADRPADDLTEADFARLRKELGKRRPKEKGAKRPAAEGPVSLVTLAGEIGRIRAIFNFGHSPKKRTNLLKMPADFGDAFGKPERLELESESDARAAANGLKLFSAAELREIIAAAPITLRAMILLGINTAYGASDCAALPLTALDLEGGWATFRRVKNKSPRRCPLWPETVAAVRAALTIRPHAANPADDALVFLMPSGERWVRTLAKDDPNAAGVGHDAVAKAMEKLLRKLGSYRVGRGFYSLRRTFVTYGSEARDDTALIAITGHRREESGATMVGVYRQSISDQRLRAVTECVRRQVWPMSDWPAS